MNDITALSQREKFEAWLEEAEALPWGYLKKRRTSDDAYHEPNTTDMWAAWQAASVEMVEALEKAQKSNQFLKDQLSELANFNPDWDKLEASYESWREIAAELLVAKDRIAELESRIVTVKLPVSLDFDCEMENGDYDIDEEPYLRVKVDGFNYALTKVRRLNGTAGIKWEAE